MGSQVHIHTLLMHVHILTKVWDQGWHDFDTHSVTQVHPCFHVSMQRGQPDIGSDLHMHTCTDACTHFNHDVGPEEMLLRHTQYCTGGTQVFHVTVQMGWSVLGESGTHVYMYWYMYTFYPGCGTRRAESSDWSTHIVLERGIHVFHVTVHGQRRRHGDSGAYAYMYWCMYTI